MKALITGLILLSGSAFAASTPSDLAGTKVDCESDVSRMLVNSSGMGEQDDHADTKTIVLEGNQDHVGTSVSLVTSYSGKVKRNFLVNLDRYYNEKGEYHVLSLQTDIGTQSVSTEGSDSKVNIKIGGAQITCVVK